MSPGISNICSLELDVFTFGYNYQEGPNAVPKLVRRLWSPLSNGVYV